MREIIDSICHQNRIELVVGSTTRHRSISNGIESIATNGWPQPDIIVIHDGARPIVEEEILNQLVSSSHKYGVILIVIPILNIIV